ncbi:MAG TPA: Gfo/Idh/MocA family oxidoreductase, partial [Phycisphaerae bacterium]|nr:Gfo/Idh/MocA family oxidoreductase [Phycisphaerae bacterium]
MPRTYGFGIVGTGMIGAFHAEAIKQLPNARLVAACDAAPGRAAEFGRKHGCEGMDDLEKFLSRDDIDVVTIGTPSGTHADIAIAVAKHGKHCISEKPMDITLDRIDRMIEAHEKAGTTLGGIFNYRFMETTRLFKQAVEQGRFGRLTFGMAYGPWWRDQAYYDSGGWRGTWAMDGGGALMNQGIHTIDLLQWFMGPVERVSGHAATRVWNEVSEVEDSAEAVFFHAGGTRTTFAGSITAPRHRSVEVEITGSDATASIGPGGLTVAYADGHREAYPERAANSVGRSYWGVSHELLIRDFYATRSDAEPFWIAPADAVPC